VAIYPVSRDTRGIMTPTVLKLNGSIIDH